MAKRQITYLAYARCWGDILDTQPLPWVAETPLGKSMHTIRRYNTVYQRCRQQRQLIIDNCNLTFLTGYDRHANDEMTEFDLTRILTGSEGTLAFITEARLDITRLPKVRRLVNVKYDSFDSARCVTRRLWLRRGRFR